MDELSMHQKRGPTTVRQLLTQIRELQNRVNSLSDAREFYAPETASSSERPTFSVNPLLFQVPEQSLAAILDGRMTHGILWVLQATFLNDYLLEKDHPQLSSKIQRIWHHLLAD